MKYPLCALVILSLALAGCSFFNNIMAPSPNIVATLESSLAAADTAALPYVLLPKCGSAAANGSKVCSDASIVKNIGIYAKAAHDTIKAAEANETASTLTAAQNALGAYQTIVSALQ